MRFNFILAYDWLADDNLWINGQRIEVRRHVPLKQEIRIATRTMEKTVTVETRPLEEAETTFQYMS